MKNIKNKFLTGILAGMMTFSLNGNVFGQNVSSKTYKQNVEMSDLDKVDAFIADTVLRQYTLQNKRVYEDFIKFLDRDSSIFEDFSQENIRIELYHKTKALSFYDIKKDYAIIDAGKGPGLDKLDFFEQGKNACLVMDLPSYKQLEIAKEYTTQLKEIMRDAGWKNY